MTTKFLIIAMTFISKVKVKYTLHLFMVRSAKISLMFPPMVLIFCTMIVYVIRISGHRYDLGVKKQGRIHLKYVLPLVNPTFEF